jgi:hypothetical protein
MSPTRVHRVGLKPDLPARVHRVGLAHDLRCALGTQR